MQTVSKTYGAADTEAQTPAAAPEGRPLGRATVMMEVCDENGKKLGSNKCSFCTTSKGQAYRGTITNC